MGWALMSGYGWDCTPATDCWFDSQDSAEKRGMQTRRENLQTIMLYEPIGVGLLYLVSITANTGSQYQASSSQYRSFCGIIYCSDCSDCSN